MEQLATQLQTELFNILSRQFPDLNASQVIIDSVSGGSVVVNFHVESSSSSLDQEYTSVFAAYFIVPNVTLLPYAHMHNGTEYLTMVQGILFTIAWASIRMASRSYRGGDDRPRSNSSRRGH